MISGSNHQKLTLVHQDRHVRVKTLGLVSNKSTHRYVKYLRYKADKGIKNVAKCPACKDHNRTKSPGKCLTVGKHFTCVLAKLTLNGTKSPPKCSDFKAACSHHQLCYHACGLYLARKECEGILQILPQRFTEPAKQQLLSVNTHTAETRQRRIYFFQILLCQ